LRRPKRVPTGTLPINPANETHLIDWKILWRSQFFTRSVSNFGTDRNEQERERERLELNGQGCRTNRNGSEIEMIFIFLGSSSPSWQATGPIPLTNGSISPGKPKRVGS
jgi:hypothetical protein